MLLHYVGEIKVAGQLPSSSIESGEIRCVAVSGRFSKNMKPMVIFVTQSSLLILTKLVTDFISQ